MSRRALAAAVVSLAVGVFAVLSFTGPTSDTEVSGTIRRAGGVCLELSRWSLLGWSVVGQTTSVTDIQNGDWGDPVAEPECDEIPEREYLVRIFNQPYGTYRMCGLADDRGCIVFRRVPFSRSAPGP